VPKEKKQRTLKSIILAGLGKSWMYWPARLEAKKLAKVPGKSGWYYCAKCKQAREKVQVDHIIPCIRPADGFTSWDDYISSRFVETSDKLQCLCSECHKEKSKEENRLRRLK
jgi:hypothetical protein